MRPNLPALKDAHHKIFYFTKDLKINGVTIGRGAGNISLNTAVGASALSNNTTGSNNTAVGYAAGNTITSGSYNTFIGYNARGSAGTNTYEIAIGNNALGLGTNTTVIGTSGNTNSTTIYGALSLPDTTASTSTITGALKVAGGAGIAGTLNVGAINVSSDLTVSGNLTVNGTTTTVNSSTLTVDDKNIELGSVVSFTVSTTGTVGSITGTGPWTATITGMVSTSDLIVGSTIAATNGVGTLYGGSPTSVVVASIVSNTSITYIVTGGTTPTAGTVTNITTTGVTDTTANGGGITLRGSTDKTIIWDSTNSNWTSSENWNIATSKTYKINNIPVLTANSVLNDATHTSVTVGGYASTLNLGAVGSGTTNINTNILYVGGKTAISTATVGIEVGGGRTGNGISYIDLISDTTYTDYSARFLRNAGANSNTILSHRGTGNLIISAVEAGVIEFDTSNTERMRIDSSGKVIVGHTDTVVTGPSVTVQGTSAGFAAIRYSDTAALQSYFNHYKSRGGTVGTPVAVQSGDGLGRYTTYGYDGTNYIAATEIRSEVDGAPGTNDMPGRLIFSTTADGAAAVTERMRIDSSGNVGIGTTLPTYKLDVVATSVRIQSGTSESQIYLGPQTNAGYIYGNSTAIGIYSGTSSNNIILNKESTNLGIAFNVSNNTILQVLSTGVGIGISSNLLADLHVYSATDTSQIVQDANSALRLLTVGGVNYIQSAATVVSGSAADLAIGSMFNVSEWMRIKASSGNVLIGTATDDTTSKLQVNGTVKATAFIGDATGLTYTGASIRPSLLLDFANSKFLDQGITFTRATTATYYGYDGLLRIAASGEARFDHDPVTKESLGLLIEEARTNLLTYSEQFDNVAGWWKNGVTISSDTTTAPDGTITADKLIESLGGTLHYISYIPFLSLANKTFSSSIYLKKLSSGSARIVNMQCSDNVAYVGAISFDLDTKQIVYTSPNNANFINTTGTITEVGNGWIRCSLTTTRNNLNTDTALTYFLGTSGASVSYAGDGTSGIYIWGAQLEAGSFATSYIPTGETFASRASTGTFVGSNGLIQTATSGTARYNYNPTNLALAPKLLLEPTASNLLPYSEQFDDTGYWIAGNVTVTANATTAPDGTTTADMITDTSAASEGHIAQNISVTSNDGITRTFSCFVKAGTATNPVVWAGYFTGTNWYGSTAILNSNGTVSFSTDSNGSYTITPYPNNWYRISVTLKNTYTGATLMNCRVQSEDWGLGGVGTGNYYVWGAQLETGTSATSYIPTTTSTAQRLADVATTAPSGTTRNVDIAAMTGTNFSSWYRQDEGTMLSKFIERTVTNTSGSYRHIYGLSSPDGLSFNNLLVQNTVVSETRVSGVSQAAIYGITNSEISILSSHSYKINDFAMSNNGSSASIDSSGLVPTNISTLTIGSTLAGESNGRLNGHIAKLAYYPKRLSNAELQSITTG